MIAEQNAAYQESLQADREKVKRKEEQKRLEEEERQEKEVRLQGNLLMKFSFQNQDTSLIRSLLFLNHK